MRLFWLAITCLWLGGTVNAAEPAAADWQHILQRAQGQTVYWNAWGGDERINAYIAWVGEQVAERYGIQLEHVKISDAASVVTRVLAEKTAGRDDDGSVDLIWINGENFATMKRNGLLYGPWAEQLPNYRWVDVAGKPTVTVDFTVPVEGLEAPWGMAQIVFMYDQASLPEPPRSMAEMLDWAQANPGRLTYPQPPDFLGSTFLKQALIELSPNPEKLQEPVPDKASFEAETAPLWAFLDALHPHLWRSARAFPANGPAQRQLLADGEIDIAISFTPGEASGAIAQGLLPASVRTFVLDGGTIGNTHFVAIPFNARAKEGAQVLANFLLSPQAQARKQDPAYWGDFTVLNVNALEPAERHYFETLDLGVATLSPAQLGTSLPEPHPSWMEGIEQTWLARYASGQ